MKVPEVGAEAQMVEDTVHDDAPAIPRYSRFPSLLNFMIILVSAISSFLFGYGNNSAAGCFAQETFIKKFLSGSNANSIIDGINAIFFGGGFLGTILQSYISTKFGRRVCAEVAAILMMISGILSASSVNPGMFIASRGIAGIAGGLIMSNTPVYMSEIAPAHTRGLLVGMHAAWLVVGYIVCSIAALGFNFVKSDIQWRLQFIMLSFFSIVCAVSIIFIPESPRWFVEQGRVEEASAIMERLHRTKSDPSSSLARAEMVQIVAQVEAEKDLPHSYWYILSNAHLRKRAYCSILVFAMVQSSGLLVIFNLMPILFAALNFDATLQLGLSIVWVTVACIGASTNAMIVDRVGRVKLLGIGGVLLMIALSIQCALQKTYLNSDNKAGINASVAFYFIFIVFYSFSVDGVVYIYNAEIWPNHLRSKGVTFGLGSYFLFGIAYNSPAALAFDTIGWKYYLVFICMTAVCTLLIVLTFPETKGLTLEDINMKFGDKVVVAIDESRSDEDFKSKPEEAV
ncbi:High-affinity glucose transporter [Lachnellula hyalina]|uniref:High-affinity glucose transporter n=1 Tax=Lachnellula hyalina TaxID=1316788 RepID=A0A8H8TZQ5_9HELO|nr:High-affinity glucose transporter [Lachnellula hyalina]TVY28434.1 High-affinity glucose transporter [Lachnellula hyalina]